MTDRSSAALSVSEWSSLTSVERCRRISRVASVVAESGELWAELCRRDWREDQLTTISGELLPLCGALKWIGRRGASVLADQRLSIWSRPIWLWGVQNQVCRRPHGQVLILGSWNYPILLVGTQIAQALAAGNQVLFKPAAGCEEIGGELASAFYQCGIPQDALRVLDSSAEAAIGAIDQGVDLIVLTGSAATGRAVFKQASESLTPMILELSGCDAVVACPTADFQRVSDCIEFGLAFNGGATCIGPRRLIVENQDAEKILGRLIPALAKIDPLAIHPAAIPSVTQLIQRALDGGANDLTGRFSMSEFQKTGRIPPLVFGDVDPKSEIANADIFAPVLSLLKVDEIHQSVEIVNQCQYRLAASVFGSLRESSALADQLVVGSVTINDLIVPTADPRVSFGGRGESGFGVTRGEQGLLAMTVPVVKSIRRGAFAPHLVFNREDDSITLLAALRALYGRTVRTRLEGVYKMVRSARNR